MKIDLYLFSDKLPLVFVHWVMPYSSRSLLSLSKYAALLLVLLILPPMFPLFENRIFKGQVVVSMRFLRSLSKLMLWALLACAYRAKSLAQKSSNDLQFLYEVPAGGGVAQRLSI